MKLPATRAPAVLTNAPASSASKADGKPKLAIKITAFRTPELIAFFGYFNRSWCTSASTPKNAKSFSFVKLSRKLKKKTYIGSKMYAIV